MKNHALILFLVSLLLFTFTACQDNDTNQKPAPEITTKTNNHKHFQTMLETFPALKLPFQKEVNAQNWTDELGPTLTDSTFIIQYLDPHFFADEERTYGYHQPAKLPLSENYEALIIPFGWNAGSDFLLHTYRADGSLIDTFMFATLKGDMYRMESHIDQSGVIRRAKVSLLYDERKGTFYDVYPLVTYYQLKEDGQIERISAPYGTADDWVGRWQLASPYPGVHGNLSIEPQQVDQFRFDVSLTVEPSMRTRDFSSEAKVDNDVAQAQSDRCPLQFKLDNNRIQLKGACQDDAMANFTGIYLKYPDYREKYLQEDPDNSFASCIAYKLIDDSYQVITLPEQVQLWMECPSLLRLSFDWRYLIGHDAEHLNAYEFQTQKIIPILALADNSDGLSNLIWSPNGEKAAFVEVNQDDFPERTRLHIIDFSQRQPRYVRHFDLKINFSCASICFSTAWSDYSWKDDQTIVYGTYEAIPYDQEGVKEEVKL